MYEFLDKRYAQALYDVAQSKGKVVEYEEILESVVNFIESDDNLKKIVKNPEITTKEKKKFFIDIFKGKMDEDLLTFLLILIEKDRILFLKEKLDEFRKIDLVNQNTKKANIITAVELTDEERAKLISQLSKKYGCSIILDEKIDPDIIGGIIIKVGDDLIDASIRTSIDDLKQHILD